MGTYSHGDMSISMLLALFFFKDQLDNSHGLAAVFDF
jgi:hypothetical protein